MSGVLGTQAYLRYFDRPVSTRQGAITCAMPAGSLVGALASSFVADKFSRKVAIQISGVIWIIGSMLVFPNNRRDRSYRTLLMVAQYTSCIAKCRAIGYWPHYLRARDWDRIQYRSHLPIRDRPERDSRTDDLLATMGHHLGDPGPVLYPIWIVVCGWRSGEP